MKRNDFYLVSSFMLFSIIVTMVRFRVDADNWFMLFVDVFPLIGLILLITIITMVYNGYKVYKDWTKS